MSSMLDQAIVDAKALKEAAIKSAESSIIEKYSQEIREAVDTMLNKEEVINEEDMVGNIPLAASDVSDMPATGEEVVELDFAELEQMIDQELAGEEDAEEMVDRHEFAEDELEDETNAEEKEDLQENDELDLTNLFEDEEINLDEETIDAIAEKLTLDFEPKKSGFLGTPVSQVDDAYEEYKALEAHAEDAPSEMEEEIGKLKESVEALQAEKAMLKEKLQAFQSKTEHFENTVLKLKDALNETSVQNAKLLYTNEALTSDSLNGRQKVKLVEAISKAKSVEEAKVIFETLQSTVSGAQKESPKTLSEAVSRKSTLLPQTNEAKKPVDPRIDRMRRLAGLN